MWCESWWKRSLLSSYLTLSAFLSTIYGKQVNVTIDDQWGDPTNQQFIQYNPPGAWSTGQNCERCSAKPRPIREAHMGTWMDATYFAPGRGSNNVSGQLVTASVPFIGTAVYVQVILTGSTLHPNGRTDLVFKIDDQVAGAYRSSPDGNKSYKFNQTVFSTTELPYELHKLTIESGGRGSECILLLDSITYTKETTDDDSANATASDDSSSNSNVGIIVGPVVGGVALSSVLIVLFFYLRRRQRIQQNRDSPRPLVPNSHSPHSDSYIPSSAYPRHLSTIDRASNSGVMSDTSTWRQAPPMYEAQYHGLGSNIASPSPPPYRGA